MVATQLLIKLLADKFMKNPVHPSRIIKAALNDLNLNVADAAQKMNMKEAELSALINGNTVIDVTTSKKLAALLGGTDKFWLKLQKQYHKQS